MVENLRGFLSISIQGKPIRKKKRNEKRVDETTCIDYWFLSVVYLWIVGHNVVVARSVVISTPKEVEIHERQNL